MGQTLTPHPGQEQGWKHETTLGAKEKDFWWKIDDEGWIAIKRFFQMAHGRHLVETTIACSDIEKLHAYTGDRQWKDLANNVEKLANHTERPGLGWFLYEKLGWDTAGAQLSSHLGAIMTRAGVWDWNGKRRGMRFKLAAGTWVELLKAYFARRL